MFGTREGLDLELNILALLWVIEVLLLTLVGSHCIHGFVSVYYDLPQRILQLKYGLFCHGFLKVLERCAIIFGWVNPVGFRYFLQKAFSGRFRL